MKDSFCEYLSSLPYLRESEGVNIGAVVGAIVGAIVGVYVYLYIYIYTDFGRILVRIHSPSPP